MHRLYRDREREHWEAKIAANAEHPKRLWNTFSAILGRGRAGRSPEAPSFTAEDFLASFSAKVQNIRDATAGSPPPAFPPTTSSLSDVNAVDREELRRIILAAAPKSCELDPLPTFLLKEYLDVLLPLLTALCNRSLREGYLPVSQKRSILIPVIRALPGAVFHPGTGSG